MSRIDKLKAKLKPPINTKHAKPSASADRRAAVIVQCVGCGHKKEINAGQIPKGEQPICEKCWTVMVPIEARVY